MNPMVQKPGPIELSILLPVRNEGINLRIMLKILRAVVEVPHEVLVIYDDPFDQSIAVVQPLQFEYSGLRLVENRMGRGVINALNAGVNQARGKYILIFAADEIGPVLAIEEMLELMEGGCDLVSCTRYAHGGRRLGGSFVGGTLSRLANFLFFKFSKSRLTDCTTGIKMFRRDVFYDLELKSEPIGWAVAFEIAIKAQMLGMKLGEVPIISIDRLYGGKSTFQLGPWVKEYLKWFLWGFRKLRKVRGQGEVVRCYPTYFTGREKQDAKVIPDYGGDGIHRKRGDQIVDQDGRKSSFSRQ